MASEQRLKQKYEKLSYSALKKRALKWHDRSFPILIVEGRGMLSMLPKKARQKIINCNKKYVCYVSGKPFY